MYTLIPAHRLRRPESAATSEDSYYRAFAPRPVRLTPIMPLAAIVSVLGFLVEFALR